MKASSPLVLVAVLVAVVAALFVPAQALAVDRTFAGSAQIDYHFIPDRASREGQATQAFGGFTLEAALKLSVDVSDHLSANVKVCVGCHGFETDMAYLDYRFADELNIRGGRFSPSFGAFNLRHDPANQRLSDKPLAYDMGRMLRLRDWNMGVLPSPFPDNGFEVNGTHWFGKSAQVDYAAYVVSGFKADTGAADIDFVQSRSGSLYYIDNNERPSYGGRVALTTRFSQFRDMTVGASGMRGTLDPKNDLTYTILGADLAFRLDRINLRLEYLVRREDLDVSDPSRFKYDVPTGGNYFLKHGGYAEVELPVTRDLDMIGRFDFLYRTGNVLTTSELKARSAVVRYTLGTAYTLERGYRVKLSGETYSFSDEGPTGHHVALSGHVGVVGTF